MVHGTQGHRAWRRPGPPILDRRSRPSVIRGRVSLDAHKRGQPVAVPTTEGRMDAKMIGLRIGAIERLIQVERDGAFIDATVADLAPGVRFRSLRGRVGDVIRESAMDGGRIYTAASNLGVYRSRRGYAAIGSGDQYALGALRATKDQPPRARVLAALRAAASHAPTVAGPFRILRITP